jgi:multiple sugar transport system permease protein
MLRGNERREYAVMLAPYVFGIAILIVIPALITFGLAVTEYDLIRSPRFNGLDNFRELWGDDIFRTAMRNSLMFIAFAVPLRLLGAVALALLLYKRFRGVAAYRTAGYLPTVVPDVAYALLWLWIFNPLYGPLNLALGAVGGPTPSWLTDPRAAQWAVIVMSLFTIGEGFIVAMATRQGIPSELYELGDIEGARPYYMFLRITLPLMAPTLLLLMFRDTIFSFQANFVPALILTNGGPAPYATTYLPLWIYRNGFEYLRYGYAAAMTLTMFFATALIVYLQYRIVKRWRHAFVV